MNYNNYDVSVVLKYKIRLVGWPLDKFASPYNFNTVDKLRDLRDALRCGSCFWMRLSSRELTRHAKEMKERTAAGEVIGTKRKERSDKGSKKGPRKRTRPAEEEKDDEGPSKKQQKVKSKKGKGKENARNPKKKRGSAKSQVPPTSREWIDSDDDE